jgi:hypothetical protein
MTHVDIIPQAGGNGESRTRYLYKCPRGYVAIDAGGEKVEITPLSSCITNRDMREAHMLYRQQSKEG